MEVQYKIRSCARHEIGIKCLIMERFSSYKVLLAVPVLFLTVCCNPSPSDLNKELEEIGLDVELPPYKIVDYHEELIPDGVRRFKIEFKGDEIKTMVPLLDSLCRVHPMEEKKMNDNFCVVELGWGKGEGYFKFSKKDYAELEESNLIIYPDKGTAEYTWVAW